MLVINLLTASDLHTGNHRGHSWRKSRHFLLTVSLSSCAAGFLLFLVGMTINIHSDHILRNLRKQGELVYRIPRGTVVPHLSSAAVLVHPVELFSVAVQAEYLSWCLEQISWVKLWNGVVIPWSLGLFLPLPSPSSPCAPSDPEPTTITGVCLSIQPKYLFTPVTMTTENHLLSLAGTMCRGLKTTLIPELQ